MNYETFNMEHPITGESIKYITVFIDDNSAKTFPADESNPDYMQFLQELEVGN